jgi:hypothetical protein
MKVNAITLPMPGHGRKPWQPRASAERQKDGFDLIIGVLGERQRSWMRHVRVIPDGPALNSKLSKCAVARPSGGIFRALARLGAGVDTTNSQPYFQPLANAFAVALEVISRGLQSVMNMNRSDLTWPFLVAGKQ